MISSKKIIINTDELKEAKSFIKDYVKKHSLIEYKAKNPSDLMRTVRLDSLNIPHIPDAFDGEFWKYWNKKDEFMFCFEWFKVKPNEYRINFSIDDTEINGANLHLIKESIKLFLN